MPRKPRRRLTGRLAPRLRPFYRRFPFTSPVSIRSADARGCVDLDLGVFYNRVPKAANSTVIVNLARERFGEDIPSKTAKRLFRRPAELARRELERFDELFRFTFVRNPYTRVLSAYLDKVERKARMRDDEQRVSKGS
ncbi:MAG: sulfotransferase family 2 domain-containing protein [Halofilum sp. (in: g-proteobacteria)]|nr:sulfotransferase family 2 domain-containing protein [Halofilum sp. (in: g-proteobacteria)]